MFGRYHPVFYRTREIQPLKRKRILVSRRLEENGGAEHGRENILETYYNLHPWRDLFYALGTSYIGNPVYNRNRGPVIVPSVRMH